MNRKIIIRSLFVISLTVFVMLIYCYLNYPFWTYIKTDNLKYLTEFRENAVTGFRGRQIIVHKTFINDLQKIDEYALKHKLKIIITEAYRNRNDKLIHCVVKPGEMSNHLAGSAIDFNIRYKLKMFGSHELKYRNFKKLPDPIKEFIYDIRKDKTLRWGGDFGNEDPIHIDSKLNLRNKQLWVQYKAECKTDYSHRIPKWKFWK